MKKLLHNIILFLSSLIIALIIAELILSWVRPAPLFEKINIFSYGAHYLLSDNRKLLYVPKPDAGEHNSYGHRGQEYEFTKGGKKRIVFMGDSVVEGFGVSYQNRFTDILQESFKKQFEIINLAVRGYDFQQEVEYFRTFGIGFSPDCVFWGITYNDLMLHSGEIYNIAELMKSNRHNNFYITYYKTKTGIESLLLKTNIYRYVKYYTSKFTNNDFEQEVSYRLEPDTVKKLLCQVKRYSAQNGFYLCFVFLPVNTLLENSQIEEFKRLVAEAGIHYIDLDKKVSQDEKQYTKDKLFFPNDPCHLTEFGHQAVADMLSEELKESHLVSKAKP